MYQLYWGFLYELRGGCKTSYITTHTLAREWLSKPDGFLTATYKEKELVIEILIGSQSH